MLHRQVRCQIRYVQVLSPLRGLSFSLPDGVLRSREASGFSEVSLIRSSLSRCSGSSCWTKNPSPKAGHEDSPFSSRTSVVSVSGPRHVGLRPRWEEGSSFSAGQAASRGPSSCHRSADGVARVHLRALPPDGGPHAHLEPQHPSAHRPPNVSPCSAHRRQGTQAVAGTRVLPTAGKNGRGTVVPRVG